MSAERRKGHRKLSRGILKSRTREDEDERRTDRGVKIIIKTSDNDEIPAPEIDEERFERLKDSYFKQCQPINMNLIRKLTDKHNPSGYNNDGKLCGGLNPGSSTSPIADSSEITSSPSNQQTKNEKKTPP